MRMNRRGFTVVELVLGILVIGLIVLGICQWNVYQRVKKINTWGVETQVWLQGSLYKWINENSFQKGGGTGGDPDPTKPPPPPGGLN